MAQHIGAFKLFKHSKDAVMRNFLGFLLIMFLPAFLILIGDAMNVGDFLASESNKFWQMRSGNPNTESMPYYVVGVLLSVLLAPAGYYLELQASKGKTLAFAEAISGSAKYYWRIFGLMLLLGAILGLGILTVIVPVVVFRNSILAATGAIAFAVLCFLFIQRYILAPYALIDKNLGIIDAMQASARISKGRYKAIWGIIAVMILLGIFDFLPVWGGLISLILLTLYTCALPLRYLELNHHTHHASKGPKSLS